MNREEIKEVRGEIKEVKYAIAYLANVILAVTAFTDVELSFMERNALRNLASENFINFQEDEE